MSCTIYDLSKKKILMNSFFKSLFSYCPLIWMCLNRTINNKIKHLHERYLQAIYNDNISSFKVLLERDGSVPIHNSNLQIFATEMFKVFTTKYAIISTFQFHLAKVYIMELKAYHS